MIEQQIIDFVPIAVKDWEHAFKNATCMNSFVEQLQSNLQHSDKPLADIITQTVKENKHLLDNDVLPSFGLDLYRLIERRFSFHLPNISFIDEYKNDIVLRPPVIPYPVTNIIH